MHDECQNGSDNVANSRTSPHNQGIYTYFGAFPWTQIPQAGVNDPYLPGTPAAAPLLP